MLLIALLVVGYIAYTRIPLTLFPDGFDYPRLFAWANYPNAGAVEVEQKVVHHLEEAIAQVSRVKKIQSSAYSGGGNARVEFQKGTDLQRAFAEMKDRLDRVMPEMPDEVEQLWIRRWDQNDIPIMEGAIVFDTPKADTRFLIDTYLEPAMRRVDGVGNVDIWGSRSKQVLIELDQGKVRGHGANIYDAVQSLRDQNLTVPGGWVIEGGKKSYVRSGVSRMVGLAYARLGRTMMGGLLASMVLTLMLVPLFYTFFDDFRDVAQKIMASAFGKKRRPRSRRCPEHCR